MDPTVPPKMYRKKTLSSADTFLVCTFTNSTCTPPDCPKNITLNFTGTIPGSSDVIVASGTLSFTSASGGLALYTASSVSATAHAPGDPDPPHAIGARFTCEQVGVTYTVNDGASQNFTEFVLVTVALQVNAVTWTSVVSGCILPNNSPISRAGDDWSVVQEYDAETCDLSETDGSEQRVDTGDECSAPAGSPSALPYSNPTAAYGSGVDLTETATSRAWGGEGCIDNGDGTSTLYSGDITEDLTVEDTEEDAIARAGEGVSWTSGSCDVLTAYKTARLEGQFEFAYREVQVRMICGDSDHHLTEPPATHTYKATVRFSRRTLGSSGPFIPYSITEVTFTADEFVEYTPWVDVPNEAGYETKAIGCSVELVS